jgi:hypothetical protein
MVVSGVYACQLVLVVKLTAVESERRLHPGQVLRVERQKSLQPLDGVSDQRAEEGEEKQRDGVLRPGLLLGLGPAEPEHDALEAQQERLLAFEDAVQVRAERLRQRQDDEEEEPDLRPSDDSHQKRSGLSSA